MKTGKIKKVLCTIKNFKNYFMAHQHTLEIFHGPCKISPAYLTYGL